MSKNKRKRQSKSSRIEKWTKIVLFLAAILGLFVTAKNEFFGGSFSPVRVYKTECIPYFCAGNAAYTKGRILKENGNTFSEAVSVRCFIKNPKSRSVIVERVSARVFDLQIEKEEYLLFLPYLDGNVLKLYAINNGWGDGDTHIFELFFSEAISTRDGIKIQDRYVPFSEITSEEKNVGSFSLNSGELLLVGSYSLDANLFKSYNMEMLALSYCVDGNINQESSLFLSLDSSDVSDEFYFMGSGNIGEDYSVQLFAKLNVDNSESEYRYDRVNPQIDKQGNIFIETVFAPTESCRFMCQYILSIDGKEIRSKIQDITVSVPVYDYPMGIVLEIEEGGVTSRDQLTAIEKKYVYLPESILQYANYSNEAGDGF